MERTFTCTCTPQVREWWRFLPKTQDAETAGLMPGMPASSIDKGTYCAMVVVLQMVRTA